MEETENPKKSKSQILCFKKMKKILFFAFIVFLVNPIYSQNWCVLYNRNQASWNNIPSGLSNKINELNRNSDEIKQLILKINLNWLDFDGVIKN